MARARNIKPSFFKNEDLAELPFSTRLLFIGLWTLADREGRLEDRPKRIKMEIFPGDDLNVEKALDELAKAGFIHRYKVGGAGFIALPTFHKHQNPHHREAPSTIPKPEADTGLEPPISPRLSCDGMPQKPEASPGLAAIRHVPAVLIPDSLIPDSLIPESKEKSKAEARSQGSRLPADWALPEEWKATALQIRPDWSPENVDFVAEKFGDYWRSKPGKEGRKSDWLATWRNWCREEKSVRNTRPAAAQITVDL